MDDIIERPVFCPRLIGRAIEQDRLSRALDAAIDGVGQALLISGEAGVGKSRLVADAVDQAQARGFVTLRGACFPYDQSCPYAPLLDMLRAHVPSRSDSIAWARALWPLLPELVASSPPRAATGDPEHDKRRILGTLTRLLIAESERQPLLVVVEDIHWSDATSLEFLLHLARNVEHNRMLLLATYRHDEVQPALRAWLEHVNRGRLARTLTIDPLSLQHVSEMLQTTFDLPQPPRPEFVDAIGGLTQGNPFFVEEVLKSLIVSGDVTVVEGRWVRRPIGRMRVPATLEDTLLSRRNALSDAARDLVDLAAVAGRRFDFDILQAASGLDETTLLRLIRELVAAQLVVEDGPDRFSFRHALTREAIYDNLLARERTAGHRSLVVAIEQVTATGSSTRDTDLAQHAFEAGEWSTAYEAAIRAAEQARSLHAPHAVVEHLARALRAAEAAGMDAPASLYQTRGWAHETLGDPEHARADYLRALELARGQRDRDQEWQALVALGFHWTSADYAQARPYFDGALALARDLGDATKIAHSLNRVGNWQVNNEQAKAALALHHEALDIFERGGDRAGIAETLDLLCIAACLAGDLDAARTYGERAAALFEELGNQYGLIGSLATSLVLIGAYDSDTLARRGHVRDAIATGMRALQLAREAGWRSGEAFVMGLLGECYSTAGEYGPALEMARAALAIAEEIDHAQWIAAAVGVLGYIYLDLHAFDEAQECVSRALDFATSLNSPYQLRGVVGALVSLRVARGALDEANDALRAIMSDDLPLEPPSCRMIWAAAAELALARGDAKWALDIVDALCSATASLTTAGDIPRLARLKAAALAALGRQSEAEALLTNALATAEALGAQPEMLRIQLMLHALAQQAGRQDDARTQASAARALLGAMADGIPDEELSARFVAGVSATLPRDAASRAGVEGLTRREAEIVAWIAQGLMNKDIAERLSVGERTIETHVSNVLRKLDFTSRVQIAAWAVEHGLARPAD